MSDDLQMGKTDPSTSEREDRMLEAWMCWLMTREARYYGEYAFWKSMPTSVIPDNH